MYEKRAQRDDLQHRRSDKHQESTTDAASWCLSIGFECVAVSVALWMLWSVGFAPFYDIVIFPSASREATSLPFLLSSGTVLSVQVKPQYEGGALSGWIQHKDALIQILPDCLLSCTILYGLLDLAALYFIPSIRSMLSEGAAVGDNHHRISVSSPLARLVGSLYARLISVCSWIIIAAGMLWRVGFVLPLLLLIAAVNCQHLVYLIPSANSPTYIQKSIFCDAAYLHRTILGKDIIRTPWHAGEDKHARLDLATSSFVSSYGLFRHMTGISGDDDIFKKGKRNRGRPIVARPEIGIEVEFDLSNVKSFVTNSNESIALLCRPYLPCVEDGCPDKSDPVQNNDAASTWVEIDFRYKPGRVARRPPWLLAPHQPRLDWQMWFAALAPPNQPPTWLLHLATQLIDYVDDYRPFIGAHGGVVGKGKQNQHIIPDRVIPLYQLIGPQYQLREAVMKKVCRYCMTDGCADVNQTNTISDAIKEVRTVAELSMNRPLKPLAFRLSRSYYDFNDPAVLSLSTANQSQPNSKPFQWWRRWGKEITSARVTRTSHPVLKEMFAEKGWLREQSEHGINQAYRPTALGLAGKFHAWWVRLWAMRVEWE